jgi:hypothetical protein
MTSWKTSAPDGKAPPRPPSQRFPFRAWSAYSRGAWAAEGMGVTPLTRPPRAERLVDREPDPQAAGGSA